MFLSVDQHSIGARSCLCAQPLFTLAVPLVCGPGYICTEPETVRELSY